MLDYFKIQEIEVVIPSLAITKGLQTLLFKNNYINNFKF